MFWVSLNWSLDFKFMKLKIVVGTVISIIFIISLITYFTTYYKSVEKTSLQYIESKCDNRYIRRAVKYGFNGNDLNDPSIHVGVIFNCEMEIVGLEGVTDILIAKSENINQHDVEIHWNSFDTLLVTINSELSITKKLDVIQGSYNAINVHVLYKFK